MAKVDALDRYSCVTASQIRDLEMTYLFPTYSRYELFMSHGAGAYVFDLDGRRYLDLLGGIAVNSLGYNHPRIVRVLMEQGSRLIHCSNLFYHPYQGLLAERLCRLSGMARAFFTNSGTEAIEAAIKIARAYGHQHHGPEKSRILTLRNSFHGRTYGALSITAQEKYQAPFRPLVPEVEVVEELTEEGLERAFGPSVCALVLEPIQGEGGIVPITTAFLGAARALCDRHDALLVLDEIQSGMGRTGKFFAFQHSNLQPDLVTVAKSLAAGYPLGAVLGSARVADSLKAGEHGTTFGGGPLACRLALEVLDIIEEEGLLGAVSRLGEHLAGGLRTLSERHPTVGEV
ncbi:MAG: aminotransferase class III-fold pyridoxal phosphate-dependent enzyme, partial [Acidobacteria bacterium]|nr:aminotransferase class III-fold pyridoxal phosphate-dependent enzyme [Acidobacteriota bacterium]